MEGGFQIGHPIASFILGREGGFKLGTLLAVSFWGGREGVHLQVDQKSVRFTDSDWLSMLPRADSCAKNR